MKFLHVCWGLGTLRGSASGTVLGTGVTEWTGFVGHQLTWNCQVRCVERDGEQSYAGVRAQPEEELESRGVQKGGVRAQFGGIR